MKVEDLFSLALGNPGAAEALVQIANEGNGPEAIQKLTEIGLRGTDIYVLWSDIYKKDAARTAHAIIALPAVVLKDAASRQDYSGGAVIDAYLQSL